MIIIKLIIYFASIILPGYLILSLIAKQEIKSLWLKLAMSYGLGAYFITIQLFLWFFIFRFSFSWWFYILLAVEFILLMLIAYKKGALNLFFNINFKLPKRLKTKELIIILLISIQLIFLFSNALARPIATYDSIAMWSFKAKILYYENQVNFNPDNDFYLGLKYHENYPWLIPLSQYWLALNLGEFNDLLLNLIFVSYLICLLIAVYYFLREYISRFKSLFFIYLLSAMPLIFYHSYNAYADLVLSFYVLISLFFLYKWLKKQNYEYLVYSGVFASISFFVKNEAIIYIIAGLLIIILYLFVNKIWFKIKHLFLYSIFIVLPVLPWIIFKAKYNLGIKNIIESELVFHPEIINNIFKVLFISNNWNIWWFIVIISLIINFKKIARDKALLFGWLFLFISLFIFAFLYIFTWEYQFALNNTALSRSILTLVPISVFLTAISYKEKKLS